LEARRAWRRRRKGWLQLDCSVQRVGAYCVATRTACSVNIVLKTTAKYLHVACSCMASSELYSSFLDYRSFHETTESTARVPRYDTARVNDAHRTQKFCWWNDATYDESWRRASRSGQSVGHGSRRGCRCHVGDA